jgi:hypothetical protein
MESGRWKVEGGRRKEEGGRKKERETIHKHSPGAFS